MIKFMYSYLFIFYRFQLIKSDHDVCSQNHFLKRVWICARVMNICWRKFKRLSHEIGTSNWIFSTRKLTRRGTFARNEKVLSFPAQRKGQFSTILFELFEYSHFNTFVRIRFAIASRKLDISIILTSFLFQSDVLVRKLYV